MLFINVSVFKPVSAVFYQLLFFLFKEKKNSSCVLFVAVCAGLMAALEFPLGNQ